jgi:hypothetical protein
LPVYPLKVGRRFCSNRNIHLLEVASIYCLYVSTMQPTSRPIP